MGKYTPLMKLSRKQILSILITTVCIVGISWYVIMPTVKVASIPHLIDKIKDLPGFQGSTVVVDARYEGAKKSTIEINTDKLIHPGSNYKLLTAAASLHYLKPDFTFKTNFFTIAHNGKKHLIIEGQGDPTFYHEDIQAMAQKLQEKNLKITGDLYYNEEYFTGEPYGPDWKPEWKDMHFGVPIGALQIDDNLLYIRGVGSAAKNNLVTETAALREYSPIIDKRILVTTPAPNKISAKMDGNGIITIEGETSGDESFSTSTVMRNPSRITASVFQQELIRYDVIPKTSRLLNFTEEKKSLKSHASIPIHTHMSAPLSEIVKRMLTFSKNNYGETLIRVLGTGSQAKGAELLKKFLTENVKIAPEDFVGVDGSGMSPSSRITGRGIMQLFEYVNQQPWKDLYWSALPTTNKEGTLYHRFLGAGLRHQVVAKTGTHEFASSLSGKIPRENSTILFSVHIFQHQIESEYIGAQVQPIIDMIIKLLDDRLE